MNRSVTGAVVPVGALYEGRLAPGDVIASEEETLAYEASRDRSLAVQEINQTRDAQLVAGVEHNGKLFHTDDRFLTELLGMILGYQAGVYTGTQDIRTRDNEIIAMNAAQIVALASAVGAHRRAVYATSWTAKDAL